MLWKRRFPGGTRPRSLVRGPLNVEQLETRYLLHAGHVSGIWDIHASGNVAFADDIVIDRDPTHPEILRGFHNGVLEQTRAEPEIQGIRIDGGAGDDHIRIDEHNGAIKLSVTL